VIRCRQDSDKGRPSRPAMGFPSWKRGASYISVTLDRIEVGWLPMALWLGVPPQPQSWPSPQAPGTPGGGGVGRI
jgi:hypothetical protein